MAVYKVSGYFKDDRIEFEDYLITDYDSTPTGYKDEEIFFHGLSEKDMEESSEDDGLDFVITKYEKEHNDFQF